MTTTATAAEVRHFAARVGDLIEAAGLVPAGITWVYAEGSKLNSIAYYLHYCEPGETGRHSPPCISQGFLGMTKNQAWDTLHAVADVLYAVADRDAGRIGASR